MSEASCKANTPVGSVKLQLH